MKMKMNLFDLMIGMMITVSIVTIVTFALEYTDYLTLFFLVIAGAFLGFPIGYCIDQQMDVKAKDSMPNEIVPPANTQGKN
jgi:hypothetical protein